MEYYNVNTPEYRKALKRNLITRYLLKLELLTYYETPIGDITKEIGIDAKGQININYNQLTRRSCSLNIANVEGKYLPSPNSPIWYNRKFKLLVGIMTHTGDIYWFSQGVYLIVSAHANAHTVSIEAVDKGGALDGTLKTNMADVQYIAKKGMSITDTIRDTLSLNMGGIGITNINGAMGGANIAIDPIPPLIDMRYNEQKLKTDVSVDENNYIGDLLISVANSYGADIYYDTQGHLRLDAMADLFIVEGYRYMAHQWDFVDLSQPDYVYEFNAINAVTVYTNLSAKSQALANAQKEKDVIGDGDPDSSYALDNIKVKNISYTAYNINPRSPASVAAIGVRRMDSQEIDYMDTTQSDMEARAQQYAIMLLQKESIKGMNVSFNCPIIPHLDVNQTIGLSDEYQGIENGTFVVQSITLPLGAESMKITATNVNWLPTNLDVDIAVVREEEESEVSE